jgi:hypothetical protein
MNWGTTLCDRSAELQFGSLRFVVTSRADQEIGAPIRRLA